MKEIKEAEQLILNYFTELFISGKIGELDTKGAVRVYETMDNNDEKTHIKITGFEFTYAFNKDSLENVFKVVLSK